MNDVRKVRGGHVTEGMVVYYTSSGTSTYTKLMIIDTNEMLRHRWAKMYELWLWILLQYHVNLCCAFGHGIYEVVRSWLVESELMIVIIILH